MPQTTAPHPPTSPAELPDSASGVLAMAREQRAAADAAEARLLQLAVQWAVIHPAETLDDAESYTSRIHSWAGEEQPVALAGPGAPLLAEFATAEFAAAVGLGTEAGKYYLGHALELSYRLPRLWQRVVRGDLAAWKARRIADATIGGELTRDAAAYVDRQVAPVAHKIRPTQLQRLIDEAIARYMPETAARRARDAADRRRFDIDTDQISFNGTALVEGELDLADALDLDDAVRTGAARLKDLGSTDTLDVRRATAVGELARRQLALDLTIGEDSNAGQTGGSEARASATGPRRRHRVRKTVLHLHLSAGALTRTGATETGGVGRVENTRSPVTADQVRAWCGHPDTDLVVKPVVDLADHVHVDQYEVPDRIAEPVALRDLACVFPHCTRPARTLKPDQHRADCDHVIAYSVKPQTCTCGIAPLCRHHHRIKTHTPWTYVVLEPGSYLWTSPHGYQFLRDHTGTLDVSRDRRPPPRD